MYENSYVQYRSQHSSSCQKCSKITNKDKLRTMHNLKTDIISLPNNFYFPIKFKTDKFRDLLWQNKLKI